MKKVIFAAALAALALVGCKKAEGVYVADTNSPVRFVAQNIGTYTVKAEAIEEADQVVGVFAGDPIKRNNVQFTVKAGKTLESATTLYWGATQTDPTPFAAMYPYDGETADVQDGSFEYVINNYEHANKFLTAYVSTEKGNNVVLPFKHPFAKLVVTVDATALENDAVKEVKIGNITLTGTVNLLANIVTKGDKVAAPVTATVDGGKYAVILYPEKTNPVIYVSTVAGDTYAFQLAEDYTFVAGAVATATVTVTGGAGDAGQGGLGAPATVGSFTVAEWGEEASAGTTEAASGTEVATDWWYLIGSVNNTVWSKAFAMKAGEVVENEEVKKVYSITFEYNKPANNNDEGFKLVKVAKDGVAAFVADLSTWKTAVKAEAGSNNTTDIITVGTEYSAWGENDNNLKLESAGTYTLTFAPEGYKINVAQ